MDDLVFFVVCVERDGDDDVRRGHVYRAREDAGGKRSGYIRVWDDSGEDYLYPEGQFLVVSVAAKEKQRLQAALPG